jgi:hypothetical protein
MSGTLSIHQVILEMYAEFWPVMEIVAWYDAPSLPATVQLSLGFKKRAPHPAHLACAWDLGKCCQGATVYCWVILCLTSSTGSQITAALRTNTLVYFYLLRVGHL